MYFIIIKGAKLMGAVGALAPTVFLPCPEIMHISVPLFLPRPEVVLILAPTLFSPVRRQCICGCASRLLPPPLLLPLFIVTHFCV